MHKNFIGQIGLFFFLIVDLILIALFVSAVERMPEYFSLPVSNISSS